MIIYFDFVGDVHAVGGFGFVRRAIRRDTREPVALKYLHEVNDVEARQRFAREVKQLVDFDHGGIIKLIACDITGPNPFYAMPWMPETLLNYCGKVTWGEVRSVIYVLADALAHVHSRGGFHRDFKPENVLVSPKKECILADFGLGNSPGCTRNFTNSVCGTPGYSAPELETLGASAAADMYSMGATLFHLTTGVHPRVARSFDISKFVKEPQRDVRELIFELTRSKPDDRPTALQVKARFVPAPLKQPSVPQLEMPPLPTPLPPDLLRLLEALTAKNPYRLPAPPPIPAQRLRNLLPPKPGAFRPPIAPPLTEEQKKRKLLQALAALGL